MGGEIKKYSLFILYKIGKNGGVKEIQLNWEIYTPVIKMNAARFASERLRLYNRSLLIPELSLKVPQAKTRPSSVRAALWESPAEIITTLPSRATLKILNRCNPKKPSVDKNT